MMFCEEFCSSSFQNFIANTRIVIPRNKDTNHRTMTDRYLLPVVAVEIAVVAVIFIADIFPYRRPS